MIDSTITCVVCRFVVEIGNSILFLFRAINKKKLGRWKSNFIKWRVFTHLSRCPRCTSCQPMGPRTHLYLSYLRHQSSTRARKNVKKVCGEIMLYLIFFQQIILLVRRITNTLGVRLKRLCIGVTKLERKKMGIFKKILQIAHTNLICLQIQ